MVPVLPDMCNSWSVFSLAESQEVVEEEHRQLQSVLRFTQTQ